MRTQSNPLIPLLNVQTCPDCVASPALNTSPKVLQPISSPSTTRSLSGYLYSSSPSCLRKQAPHMDREKILGVIAW
eukprot:34285-Eustigmatos_ZCMA.PRE.1